MKTKKSVFLFRALFTAILFILPYKLISQVADSTIIRSAILDKNAVIYVENSVGDIDIKTWNKNELKVEFSYHIEAESAETLSSFQRKLNKYLEDQLKAVSTGKVILSSPFQNFSKNNDEVEVKFRNEKTSYKLKELKCNLLVYVPEFNPLNARSQFNKLTIDNIKSDATIDISSTRFLMGNCKKLDLKANFCRNMQIGNIESAVMEMNSSNLAMGRIESDLTLNSNFSNIGIESIGNKAVMVLNSSSLETKDIRELNINGSFIRNFKVNNVEKAKISLNSSKFEANKIDFIEADEISFSDIRINDVNNILVGSSSSSEFSFDQLNSIDVIKSSFSTFNVNNLKKSFKTISNSGKTLIKNVLPGFEEINIDGDFVIIDVHAAPNTNFTLSADLSFPSYNFKDITYQNHEKDMSHEVMTGRRGTNKTEDSKIILKCQSCKITLD